MYNNKFWTCNLQGITIFGVLNTYLSNVHTTILTYLHKISILQLVHTICDQVQLEIMKISCEFFNADRHNYVI